MLSRFKIILPALFVCCALARAEPVNCGPYVIGEVLTYQMYWGLLHVGEGTFETSLVKDDAGAPLIRLRFTGKSKGVVSAVYPVDDCVDSFIDPETQLPVKVVKKTREGDFVCDDTLTFDRSAGLARWEDHHNNTAVEYPIEPGARDFYSMMYGFRTDNLKCGDEKIVPVAVDNMVHKIRISVMKEEPLKVESMGTVQSFRLGVKSITDGLFVRKIPGTMWVTSEEPKILIRMNIKVPVGKVRMVFEKKTFEDPASQVAAHVTLAPVVE